jgi:hypothetical protein
MEPTKVSRTLLKRLPVYLNYLKSLPEGNENISATAIANALDLGHVLVRKDLAKITGEDESDFAIIIGEISETSGSAQADKVARNQKFIAKQRKLAEMNNVYIVASGQFKINQLDENGNNKNGQDEWHWVTTDAFAIGELVGQCIVENLLAAK